MIGDRREMLFFSGKGEISSIFLHSFRFNSGKPALRLLNSPSTTRIVVARHPIIRFWSAWNQKFLKGLWLRKQPKLPGYQAELTNYWTNQALTNSRPTNRWTNLQTKPFARANLPEKSGRFGRHSLMLVSRVGWCICWGKGKMENDEELGARSSFRKATGSLPVLPDEGCVRCESGKYKWRDGGDFEWFRKVFETRMVNFLWLIIKYWILKNLAKLD